MTRFWWQDDSDGGDDRLCRVSVDALAEAMRLRRLERDGAPCWSIGRGARASGGGDAVRARADGEPDRQDAVGIPQDDFAQETASIFASLSECQEPLGAEFEAVWDQNLDSLYQ